MSVTLSVAGDEFDRLGRLIEQLRALLYTVDQAQLLDHLTCSPEQKQDRLAFYSIFQMIIEKAEETDEAYSSVVDTPATTAIDKRWEAAELHLRLCDEAVKRVPAGTSDDDMRGIVDAFAAAERALVRLPATNMRQALRRIEVAAKDGVMTGVDLDELISEAKGLL